MPNAIAKIFGVILITFLFYYATYQNYKKEVDLAYINTENTVNKFVDNVRLKGFITPSMYEDFVNSLHTGNTVLFSIEMEHEKKQYTPVYKDPAKPESFTGEYQVQYTSFYWEQIKKTLFESDVPYDKRMYKLENGDYFSVNVENKTKFKATMLFDFLTGSAGNDSPEIVSRDGGMVQNQDWNDKQ
ncbi:hypothetical protein [Lysinibacillus xylanilyticus]|uniref:Uncharacterized protein n=1 Tax=Lysinibacillus xylanilyticus TaxID=582475 RepID=A0A2M9QA06_9BACI|nr:hypothetical protein [Lysinibacillus xylanilyticus]PJO44898.1 hypothetical protein CWD94_04215 [Lysinibacillus xylanilyticus]